MLKIRISAFITAIVMFLYCLSAACLVQAAETDSVTDYNFEYDAQEVFYDFEFDSDAEFSTYGCQKYDSKLPDITTETTGESVALFDLSTISSGRIGFQFPVAGTKSKVSKLKTALNAGPVIYEFKAKINGSSIDANIFFPLVNIMADSSGKQRLYFSNMQSWSDVLSENEWHTFSLMIDYSSGTADVLNIMVDDIIFDVNSIYDVSSVDKITTQDAMKVYVTKSTNGTWNGTLSLDYLRVYKPQNYDNTLILKRFYSSLMKSYKNYSNFDESWLDLIDADGKFSDLTYDITAGTTNAAVNADRYEHVYRLKGMAAEYSVSGRTLYKDETLLNKLILATNFFVSSKFDSMGNNGSWTTSMEGPTVLADVFLMLREAGYDVDSFLDAGMEHYFILHEDEEHNYFALNTSNLPITCHLWRVLAVLYDDVTYVQKIYDNTAKYMTDHVDEEGNGILADDRDVNVPNTIEGVTYFGDGFYPDGTYYGHGPLPYSLGYGLTYLRGNSGYVKYAAGTSWQFSEDELSVLVGIILDNYRWIIRGDNSDFSALGRNVDVIDNGKKTHGMRANMLSALEGLLEEPNIPRREELELLSANITDNYKNYLTGNKHFWQSDLMAHQRNGYSAILKMSSTRTLKSENVAGDGNNAYYMSTGTLPIMVTGEEYEDAIVAWDWDRLPGITAINKAEDVPEQTELSHIVNRHYGSHSFVGGATDGTYGVAAMDYLDNLQTKTTTEYANPSAPVVQAKKAWFFFNNEIVALGTDVSSTDAENNLLTNLNQSILDGDVTYKDASGQNILASETLLRSDSLSWVHHGNIGYVLPEAQTAAISNKSQTGNGRRQDDDDASYPDYTRNIFSMYVDHGTTVADDDYSYIIVPNKTASEVSSYASDIPVSIVKNDSDVQAVYHNSLNIGQVVFRTAGSSVTFGDYTVTADKPCIAMVDFSGESITAYVQNPENTQTDITLNFKNAGVPFSNTMFTTEAGFYAGETVTQVVEQNIEVQETIPEFSYYYKYEFDDSTQGLPGGLGYGGDKNRTYETKDGRGVLKFPGTSSLNLGGTNFTKLKEAVIAGKEVCVEYNVYFDAFDGEFGIFNRNFLFYSGTAGKMLLDNNTYQSVGASYAEGWNKVSFVLYLAEDGNMYYKDFTLNGSPSTVPSKKLPSRFDTTDEFFTNLTSFQIFKMGSDVYLDYLRVYSIEQTTGENINVLFRKEDGNPAKTFADAAKISLGKNLVGNGAVVFASYYNNENLLLGTNRFDIQSFDDNFVTETLVKPENSVNMKVFVFNNIDAIKPLLSSPPLITN